MWPGHSNFALFIAVADGWNECCVANRHLAYNASNGIHIIRGLASDADILASNAHIASPALVCDCQL